MSDNTKDGGPAFPHPNPEYSQDYGVNRPFGGMSMRDWFAGQALVGLSSATNTEGEWQSDPHGLAERAFEVADAMLRARAAS